MPPKGYRKQDPAERQKLLTAVRSIVSVLVATDPGNFDLMFADRALESYEREQAARTQATAGLPLEPAAQG